MKIKQLVAALAVAFATTGVFAQNAIIQNEYVRAGVNETTGTFGSGGNTRPGLQYDSTGTGTFPADSAQGDYLTPGSPFDGFAVKVNGTNYSNNNSGGAAISGAWVGTPSASSAVWAGGITGVFNITNTYRLPAAQQYIDITSAITAQQAMATLSFGRFIDPDAMPAPGDTSATDNVLGYGVIPKTNVVFSEATVSRYALGLYSTNSNVTAGIQMWSQEADAYNGSIYGADYGNGDDTIGLSWTWSGVSAGDILTANYAYIFGPSAFGAATTAIAGGAGGGADVTGGATLTDIGSATDAAAGGGTTTPTLVSSTATNIVTTREAVSATLPVLTASITHHEASDNGKVQTIAREKTTSVTTPVEVTTTTVVRTTKTYSDSSTVVTDGTPSDAVALRNDVVTTITDPGTFTGRVDQIDKTRSLQDMSIRGLDFNGVAVIRDFGASNTTGFAIGGQKDIDDGIFVGGGIAHLGTSASVTDGAATASTNVISIRSGKNFDTGTVTATVKHAMSDYSASRTIGDFANSGKTTGTDTSMGIKLVGNNEIIRPVVGITTGSRTVGGYTESGDIQSARTVSKTTNNYTYGTVGAQATFGMANIEALHHTDGVNSVKVGIAKEWEKDKSFAITAQRNFSDIGNTTAVAAGIIVKF